MDFGDYLRKCREKIKRTQPDVAAQIEIEQSYLSKLETGKSIPSEEVFSKLQQVYDIDLDEMIVLLSPTELIKLAEIKPVQAAISRKNNSKLNSTRKLSIGGLIMLMLGVGFLAITIIPDRSQEEFSYRSEGVLKAEEDLNTFELVYKNLQQIENDKSQLEKRVELLVRLDQQDQIATQYKGEGYVLNTEKGRRFFKLIEKRMSSRSYVNRWFFVPALMFLTGGFGCFFIARRWN